jgi:hypothetical protein
MDDIALDFGTKANNKPRAFELTYEALGVVTIPRPKPIDINDWDSAAVRKSALEQYRSLLSAKYNTSAKDTDRKDNITRCCIRLAIAKVPVPSWISKRFDDFENYGKSKMPNKSPPMTFVWCPDKMDKSLKELEADLSRYCPPRTVYGQQTQALLQDYWLALQSNKKLHNLQKRIDACRQENELIAAKAIRMQEMGLFVWDHSIDIR